MEDKIIQILNDLYQIEPTLKEREAEIKELITKLLESRPDTKLDREFIVQLREQVMAEAGRLSETRPEPASWFANLMNMNKFAFAAGVAAITLLIAVPVINMINRPGGQMARQDWADSPELSLAPKFTKVASNAFGTLNGLMSNAPVAAGRGGGGGAAMLNATAESTAPVAGMGGDGDAKMGIMPPYYQNYIFKYEGDALDGLASSLTVYKRTKDLTLGKKYAESFTGRDLGYFNLDKFQNLEAASLNFVENRDFGYSVYFSLYDNSFGVSANWEKWPHPEQECRDEVCFQQYQLNISDVPADAELIAIADAFLKEYGIDMAAYGQPQVNKYWEREMQNIPDPANYYVPETVSVIYPLLLDGQTVKDEGGNPAGVYVDVNIRQKKGYGINNLFVPSFEKSDYETVTDAASIIKIAENGGNGWVYADPNAQDTVTLKLGTPTVILMRYWWYDQTKPASGNGQELYIPALLFPVTNKDEAKGYYRDSVTVPLVKEVFDAIKDQGNGGNPVPMPLIQSAEPAVEETPAVLLEPSIAPMAR